MATPISVSLPHRLGKAEARRRIDQGFAGLTQGMTGGVGALLTLNQRWEGDRLNFDAGALGQRVAGRVDVLEDSVRIEVELPTFLVAIAEQFKGKLEAGGQKLLK